MINGISYIIPTYSRAQKLPLLVDSILKQKLNLEFEILIIQNNVLHEADALQVSAFESQSHAQLKIFHLKEAGVNYSRNFGLRQAKYDLMVFLDDDCELTDEHLIQKHLDIQQKDNSLFAVGGLYQISDQSSFFSKLYQNIQMDWLFQGLINESQTRYLIGGHFSVKKKFVLSHQIYFNSLIQYGGSELSFFAEAHQKNLKMELHHFSVLHHTHENFFSLTRKLYKQGRGLALLDQATQQQNTLSHEEERFFEKFFKKYLNLIFWYGYYNHKKSKMAYVVFLFRHFKSVLIQTKYKLLDRMKNFDEAKKQRGDRL